MVITHRRRPARRLLASVSLNLRLHEGITMNWTAQNHLDAALLERMDVSPLDTHIADQDPPLAALIQKHNADMAELTSRFQRLADDRAAMADADAWLAHHSATIRTESQRLVAESWDVLAELRSLLGARQALLRQLQFHIADRSAALANTRQQAFAKAQRTLAREHRVYLKAEPLRGQAYVDDLALQDERVVDLDQQLAALEAITSVLQSSYQRTYADMPALTARQRDMIEHLSR